MKRHHFPFEAVARVRQSARDRAAVAAAQARRDAARADQVLSDERARYGETVVVISGVRTAEEMVAHRFAQDLAAQRVRDAVDRAEVANDELLGRRAALAAAVAGVRALEELERRQRAAHDLERRQTEAAVTDDLVATHAARARGDEPEDIE